MARAGLWALECCLRPTRAAPDGSQSDRSTPCPARRRIAWGIAVASPEDNLLCQRVDLLEGPWPAGEPGVSCSCPVARTTRPGLVVEQLNDLVEHASVDVQLLRRGRDVVDETHRLGLVRGGARIGNLGSFGLVVLARRRLSPGEELLPDGVGPSPRFSLLLTSAHTAPWASRRSVNGVVQPALFRTSSSRKASTRSYTSETVRSRESSPQPASFHARRKERTLTGGSEVGFTAMRRKVPMFSLSPVGPRAVAGTLVEKDSSRAVGVPSPAQSS